MSLKRYPQLAGDSNVAVVATPATASRLSCVARRGFTLVEMLVVISIIGILVALLIPTIGASIRRAKNAATTAEISQLMTAIEAYAKDHNSNYPPDFTSREGVIAHFNSAFPNNQFNVVGWLTSTGTPDPRNLDPAEALVFWLSMTYDNARNPLRGPGKVKSYYDFKADQLQDLDNDGWPEYYAKNVKTAPYVYFDGRVLNADMDGTAGGPAAPTCVYAFASYPSRYSATAPMPSTGDTIARAVSFIPPIQSTTTLIVRPYRSNEVAKPAPPAGSEVKLWPNDAGAAGAVNNTQWIAPGKFQLLCAGLDGKFGFDNTNSAESMIVFKQFPKPNYYVGTTNRKLTRENDDDNLADFSEGKTIGDSVP